ncbi:MAG: hypothetical protein CO170_02715 [candidate division SR1 bacterium CG_4_9_14_3_um_filter_40_9]|nr:MAG: hypothetical protein CO170_02715 [candidate division SR1 bacterium CG_4_9_14_3_um_filter_40_9]
MALSFDGYKLTEIINPNGHCTQIGFTNENEPDVKKRGVILFDRQIRYIEVEEHQKFKRVKVYTTKDAEPMDFDFLEDNYANFDLFLRSIYNQ